MTCGLSCVRMILIIFNVVFWLSGLAVLAIGIWMRVDDSITDLLDFISTGSDDDLVEYAAYILIGIGAFAVIVGFCGCCGAVKKNKCLLGLYIFFLFIVMAGELGAGIMAVVYRDDIEDELEDRLTEAFEDDLNDKGFIYMDSDDEYVFTGFGQVLSYVQNELECCGIADLGTDYAGTNAVEGKSWKYLPTCCKDLDDREDYEKDPDDWVDELAASGYDGTCSANGGIYEDGCFEEAQDWFDEKAYILIGVGIGIACIEIFGFIFAICLCRNIDYE